MWKQKCGAINISLGIVIIIVFISADIVYAFISANYFIIYFFNLMWQIIALCRWTCLYTLSIFVYNVLQLTNVLFTNAIRTHTHKCVKLNVFWSVVTKHHICAIFISRQLFVTILTIFYIHVLYWLHWCTIDKLWVYNCH